MAKAGLWAVTDAEERKRGERTGLDTLVVHAVNVGYLVAYYTYLFFQKWKKSQEVFFLNDKWHRQN